MYVYTHTQIRKCRWKYVEISLVKEWTGTFFLQKKKKKYLFKALQVLCPLTKQTC